MGRLPDGTVWREPYDGLQKVVSEKARLICDPDEVVLETELKGEDIVEVERYPGRSLTRQSEKDSADINVIVDRMARQGIGPVLNPREPRFLDISEVGSFREAFDQVRDARAYFMELDAEDRRRFRDDPAVFLDTINDPVKLQALIDEGIIVDGSIVGGAPRDPPAPAPA